MRECEKTTEQVEKHAISSTLCAVGSFSHINLAETYPMTPYSVMFSTKSPPCFSNPKVSSLQSQLFCPAAAILTLVLQSCGVWKRRPPRTSYSAADTARRAPAPTKFHFRWLANMAAAKALRFGQHLKELRIHMCQKSPASQGVRYVKHNI